MDEVVRLATGAIVTPSRRIANPKGDIFHGLKSTDDTFAGFGEAYFSVVHQGMTKGWKRHGVMTLNLVVPVGTIEFHLRSDDGTVAESIQLGERRYARLTVPAGVWMAFSGVDAPLNLLLNVASIPHDPDESVSMPIEYFSLGR